MPSVLLNGLYRNPACQAASDSTPKTSKWPYSDHTPWGTPTCTERFSILLVHSILGERLDTPENKAMKLLTTITLLCFSVAANVNIDRTRCQN